MFVNWTIFVPSLVRDQPHCHRSSIVAKHFSTKRCKFSTLEFFFMNQFHSLLCLNCTYNRCHHWSSRHSATFLISFNCHSARSTALQFCKSRRLKCASITIFARDKHLCHSLKSADSSIYPRYSCTHTQAIESVASPSVVETTYHHIHFTNKS